MQPPLNPYGDGGGAGWEGSSSHRRWTPSVWIHCTQAQCTGSFGSRESGWSCAWSWRSPLHPFPFVLHLRRHSWGHSALLASAQCLSGSLPRAHTHTQELRARQTPFVNLKETATERVRLQEILPFPLTRRHGACPSRV